MILKWNIVQVETFFYHQKNFRITITGIDSTAMPICSVEGCSSLRELHVFPSDDYTRRRWIQFCGRSSSWAPGPGARICRLHFTSDSYATRLQKFLKKGAVPTIRGRVDINKFSRFSARSFRVAIFL